MSVCLVLAVVSSIAAAEPASKAAPVDVPPGAVAHWQGETIDRCAIGDRGFAPLADACWFPVDLLAAGTLEISRRRHGAWERRTLRIVAYPYPVERVEIADQDKVNPPARDLARIEEEQRRVARLWSLDTPRRFALPLRAPLAELPQGGRFGARRIFNGEPRSPHSGTDFSAKEGTAVFAAAPGRVVLAEDQFFAGRAVFIDHGDGLITMYFHLSRIDVRPGQEVAAGDRLGLVGATGRVSGPHLHFAARWRGARIDPTLLLAPAGATEVR